MTKKYYFLATSKSTGRRYVCESDRQANAYREANSVGYATGASFGKCIYFKFDGEWVEETNPQDPMFFSNDRWEVIPLILSMSDNTLPREFTFQ